MDIQAVLFALDPVRNISEAVHSYIFKRRIFRKPFLRPEVSDRARLTPCPSGAATQAVHEYEVDQRVRRRVEKVQSERPFRIVHAIITDDRGREGGGGRQVGVLAPKGSNRLCKFSQSRERVRRPSTIFVLFGVSLHIGSFLNLPCCRGIVSPLSLETTQTLFY